MTTYTFTIGGTAMPLPDAAEEPQMDYFAIAVTRRMWSGTLRQQVITQRWRAPLRFVKLSVAEYATVFAKYAALLTTSQAAVFANGRTITVMAIPHSGPLRRDFHRGGGVVCRRYRQL
jgi:hypothetical protein